MVMHARKTPRISDGYFEKHQAHPYQNSSKYSSSKSSSASSSAAQQVGGSSSSSSDHHRSYSDSHHHRLSRDSPNNGTYHSGGGSHSHHHHHRGGGGGGGSSLAAEGVSPPLDDVGGSRKGYAGSKMHSKEREIRDYKRDKYSDCSRSPKDSTLSLSSSAKQRSSRGPSSTSGPSTATLNVSSVNANSDMPLGNTGTLLVDRDRTNHDRSCAMLIADQQMIAADSGGGGGSKINASKSSASRSDGRGSKQQQGSLHNNCLDKHSAGETRHSTSNTSSSHSQSSSSSNPNSQSQSAATTAISVTNSQQSQQSSTSQSRVGDWSEHLSSSGKRYYYNCKTEVSQWEKPREWLLLDRDSNSQRSSASAADRNDRDRSDRGDRGGDRERSESSRQYSRDSRDSRDGGRERGDGGGYSRVSSTRHAHDKHSNSRQSSSSTSTSNASSSSASASGDQRQQQHQTSHNSTNSSNATSLAISASGSGGRPLTGDKLHPRQHGSSALADSAAGSRDNALDIGQKDNISGGSRLNRLGAKGGNSGYHHQQQQQMQQMQQEAAQDMDISPGDSTPTSETSPSNTSQSTNAANNSTVLSTAVLLANALPRLTSHPITPSTTHQSISANDQQIMASCATIAASKSDLSAAATLDQSDASGGGLQDGGATPTHSELPDVGRGDGSLAGQSQQLIGINGSVVMMPGSALQAVMPMNSNSMTSQQQPNANVTNVTTSIITSLASAACSTSIVRAASSSAAGGNSIGNHLVTASLAQHVRDDLLVHVRGWPADIIERQAIKCAEEAALVGGIQCARVSAELKTARAIVRLTEIQATLQEQRILFLRQQIKMLEELKSQNSFMSDDT